MKFNQFFNFNSRAQGTIEYLVIIAIVIVISLVVVALLLGIFENNSDVTNTAQQIQTQTLPVALNEAIIGTGEDANGLIVLTNNTGDVIRDVRVLIDGKDHNYFDTQISLGSSKTFRLNTLEIPCDDGETSVTKTITIIYTTRSGIEKTQKIENIKVTCATTDNPTPTKTPTEEKQEDEEEPIQTPTDTTDPELTNLTSEVDGNTIHLTFRAWDNNDIDTFEINENDGGYQTIEPEYVDDYLDGNYYTIINENLEYETEYTFCIKVTDYNNNSAEDCDTNTTSNPPTNPVVTALREGLIGYWPLDETSGTTVVDYSNTNNNGTISSLSSVAGKVGNAYSINRSANLGVTVPTNSLYNFGTNNFSLGVWFYGSSGGSWGNYPAMISSKAAGWVVGSNYLSYNNAAFGAKTIAFNSHENDFNGVGGLTSTGIYEYNTWHFAVVTRSGNLFTLYINGYPINSDTKTGAINIGTSGMTFGGDNFDGAAARWNGYLDEVTIWNRALTANEVLNLYNLNTSGIGLK